MWIPEWVIISFVMYFVVGGLFSIVNAGPWDKLD